MVRLWVKTGDDFIAFNEALDLQAVGIGWPTTKANQVRSELILEALG